MVELASLFAEAKFHGIDLVEFRKAEDSTGVKLMSF